jgi:Zn-dependent protease
MVNPRCFKSPNRDMMIVTACGPLMNLLLALAFGIPFRYILASGIWTPESLGYQVFLTFLEINLALMFFNLIPIPPLDGSKILYGLLPFSTASQYERFMAQYGIILLMVLFFTGAAGYIIGPAVMHSMGLITGREWIG